MMYLGGISNRHARRRARPPRSNRRATLRGAGRAHTRRAVEPYGYCCASNLPAGLPRACGGQLRVHQRAGRIAPLRHVLCESRPQSRRLQRLQRKCSTCRASVEVHCTARCSDADDHLLVRVHAARGEPVSGRPQSHRAIRRRRRPPNIR
jgi:RNase adaptor protein for sRNA GlmZ degradation